MNNRTQQKPMRTIWHSLLWKEWHEHKWKLVGLIALAIIVLAFNLWIQDDPAMLLVTVQVTLFFYGVLTGLFLGMYTAGGENGCGTMQFLQTLPVPMRKPAGIRLFVSWATLVVPVLVVIGLAYAYLNWHNFTPATLAKIASWPGRHGMFSSWGFEDWLLGIGISGILFVTSLLLWMSAAGANRSDEIRAGAVGFLTMGVLWFGLAWLGYLAEKLDLPGREYGIVVIGAAPGGIASAREQMGPWGSTLPFIITAVIGHAGLLAWYLRRYGRKAVRPARTLGKRVKATKSDWLAPPRRSQLTAIIWKQVHETGPLAIMAAAAVLAMASLAFWANLGGPIENSFTEILAGITFFVGFLVTVVAGMGVFLEDLKPKVSTFWRSRPVNTTTWFFVKFFTGLAVLVVTFGALLLVAYAFDTGRPYFASDDLVAQVAYSALIFLLIYTLSMASYCLGRQPITAVVIVLGIFCLGVPVSGYLFVKWVPFDWGPSAAVAGMLVAQVAATVVAWLAFRNNWGWHK